MRHHGTIKSLWHTLNQSGMQRSVRHRTQDGRETGGKANALGS